MDLAGYCPYDLVFDPAALGCEEATVATSVGDLHVITRPSSSGRTTLLLHGVGGTWRSWTPFIQAADAAGLDLGRLVLVDLPGFGTSTNTLGSLRSRDIGNALRDEVIGDTAELAVFGQSMGGFLALDMAADRPEGMVFVCAVAGTFFRIADAFRNPVTAARHHQRLAVGAGLIRLAALLPGGEQLISLLLDRVSSGGTLGAISSHPALLKPLLADSLGTPLTPHNLVLAARNATTTHPREHWADLKVPCLCVFGVDDGIVDAEDRATAARVLSRAKHHVLQDAAHIAHAEWPIELVELVAAALPDPT